MTATPSPDRRASQRTSASQLRRPPTRITASVLAMTARGQVINGLMMERPSATLATAGRGCRRGSCRPAPGRSPSSRSRDWGAYGTRARPACRQSPSRSPGAASIRARREALKMTQAELGDRLGLSRTSVTNIECGRQRLLIDQFCRLSEVLNCQRDDLLSPAMSQSPDQRPAGRDDLASMPTVARFVQKALQGNSERKA